MQNDRIHETVEDMERSAARPPESRMSGMIWYDFLKLTISGAAGYL